MSSGVTDLIFKIDVLPPHFLLNNKLVKHGHISYITKKEKIKKRYMFLYNNGLMITSPKYEGDIIAKYVVKKFLQTKTSVRIEDLSDYEFLMKIPLIKKGVETAKLMTFKTNTINDKNDWIKDITKIFYTSPTRTYSTDVLVSPRLNSSSGQLDCYDYAPIRAKSDFIIKIKNKSKK